jgi:UDP-N-acetylmuramyl pentapeptide synthase
MNKALERVIEKIKTLPEDRQQYAAEVLEEIVFSNVDGVYVLGDEERRLVEEGLADLDAENVVPEDEMTAFWDRHRK